MKSERPNAAIRHYGKPSPTLFEYEKNGAPAGTNIPGTWVRQALRP